VPPVGACIASDRPCTGTGIPKREK
jgi:hypothetical protein